MAPEIEEIEEIEEIVMIRKVVAMVLLLVAIVFFVGPLIVGKADTDRYADELTTVLADDRLNNTRTEGAPQQQVVNGWTARDLLVIQTNQNNDLLELEYRQLALLLVLALLLGWSVVSQHEDAREAGRVEAPAPSTPTNGPTVAAVGSSVSARPTTPSPPGSPVPPPPGSPVPPPPGAEGNAI